MENNWDVVEGFKQPNEKLAETRTKEIKDDNGQVVQRVVETWVEKVPMSIQSRVVEKISPVVLERTTESFHDDEVVGKQIEAVKSTSLVAPVESEFISKADFNAKLEDLKASIATVCSSKCACVPCACTAPVKSSMQADMIGLEELKQRVLTTTSNKSLMINILLWTTIAIEAAVIVFSMI